MMDFSKVQNYYIACGYTDMRKQIDGLAALVQMQFSMEMDEASIFLFCGRRADRIKALYRSQHICIFSVEACCKLGKRFTFCTLLVGGSAPNPL